MSFREPQKILDKLSLKESATAADFGCGSGGWVIPLARKLKEGKVYAIDILEEPLSALKSKLALEGIFNVETVKSNVEKTSKLRTGSCDLILMSNLLFEADNKESMLKEAERTLKGGGQILIVDWKTDAPLGPAHKVSSDEVKKIAPKINLKVEKEFEAGIYHWGLILAKPR